MNGGPNALHAEPTIAAARAGKHVLCEKPLALSAGEAHTMWRAAEDAGVVHATGFNYRFVPAVRLARELVQAGELGEIVHFRARYLQSWGWDAAADDWHFDPSIAGTGALGDLGAHSIDLARHLVGEIRAVSATVRTFVPGRAVDDAFVATVEFESGATGTLEASRLARGRINHNAFELNGTKGSLAFDQERMNELQVSDGGAFRTVLEHGDWWPPGHIIGWGDTFTYEYLHLLKRDHRRRHRRTRRRDVRGRLPLRARLRRHPPLLAERQQGDALAVQRRAELLDGERRAVRRHDEVGAEVEHARRQSTWCSRPAASQSSGQSSLSSSVSPRERARGAKARG